MADLSDHHMSFLEQSATRIGGIGMIGTACVGSNQAMDTAVEIIEKLVSAADPASRLASVSWRTNLKPLWTAIVKDAMKDPTPYVAIRADDENTLLGMADEISEMHVVGDREDISVSRDVEYGETSDWILEVPLEKIMPEASWISPNLR